MFCQLCDVLIKVRALHMHVEYSGLTFFSQYNVNIMLMLYALKWIFYPENICP